MTDHEYIFPIEHMVGEFDNFIALWKKFIPKQICEQIVEKVDNVINHSAQTCDVGKTQFPSRKMGRDDLQIILNDYDVNFANTINDYLKCCLTHYCQEYSQLIGVKLMSYAIKAQKPFLVVDITSGIMKMLRIKPVIENWCGRFI